MLSDSQEEMVKVSFSQTPQPVQLKKCNSLKQALFDTKASLSFSKGPHASFT